MTNESLNEFIEIYNKIYKIALEIENKDELDHFSFEFTHNNSRISYSYYNYLWDDVTEMFIYDNFPITYLLASTPEELEKATEAEKEYQRKSIEEYKRKYEEEQRLKEEKELQEKIAKEKAIYEELKAKYGE